MDRRVDLAIALAVVALGIFVISVARTIDLGLHKDAVGPRAFFYGIGAVFVLGGGVLAGRRLRGRAGDGHAVASEGVPDEEGRAASAGRAAGIVALSLGYAFALQPLGYLLATPAFIVGGLAVMGERRLRWPAAAAVAFTAAFYLVFAQFLDIRIPVGPFTGLFRELGWIVL